MQGYYWGHAEQWQPEYTNHSYIRIRDLESGDVVSNISTSIGFGFVRAAPPHPTPPCCCSS